MDPRSFLTKEEQNEIVELIRRVELNSSGELRVHIESDFKGKILKRVLSVFKQLKIHKTKNRNGILLYVAVQPREFYVYGDKGIDKAVPDDFWSNVRDLLIEHFRKNEFMIGYRKAIEMCEEQLKEHFPYQADDVNELLDTISYGD